MAVKSFAMARTTDSNLPTEDIDFGEIFHLTAPETASPVLFVCEHASNRIPDGLNNLGVSDEVIESHVAWDPGAFGVAEALARLVPAPLFAGNVSRLVYDCNRPPEAASAVPERSEVYDIAGNQGLAQVARAGRVRGVYEPFSQGLSDAIRNHSETLRLMVTIHSFTPVYNGHERKVEIGILHGKDERFAHSMMKDLPAGAGWDIRLNEPYGAADGVAHTLDAHGHANGLLNVMIEIRNDLIRTSKNQVDMAEFLAPWIMRTLEACDEEGAAA
ncbi:MAG: N-formylglutamate amidohydrolase [Brevirhabdus sp.]